MTEFYIAAHGLIEKEGRFLVTRRSAVNDYMPLKWDLPGGTVDPGETLEVALCREIAEETSLLVDPGSIVFGYMNLGGLPLRQTLQVVLRAAYRSGEIVLNPEEHDDHRWITWNELDSLDLIAFLAALRQSAKISSTHRQ
jgi:8-oxo-dGTP diphosphatase